MAIYSISQLLDLAHSPLVKAPEGIDAIDFKMFTVTQRPGPNHTQREHKQRSRNPNSWKKPAWDTQGMELAAPKQPETQVKDTPTGTKSPSRPNVELWEGNFASFQKKDGSSRFSSLFGPNSVNPGSGNGSGTAQPGLGQSPAPGQGHAPANKSLLGMLSKEPLDSMGSIQSSLPQAGPALPPFGLFGSPEAGGGAQLPSGPPGIDSPRNAPPGLSFPGSQMSGHLGSQIGSHKGPQARSQSPQMGGSQVMGSQTNPAHAKHPSAPPGFSQTQGQGPGQSQNVTGSHSGPSGGPPTGPQGGPPGLSMMFGSPNQTPSRNSNEPKDVSTNDLAFFNSLLTRSGPTGPSQGTGPAAMSGPPGLSMPPSSHHFGHTRPAGPPGYPSNPSTPHSNRPQGLQGQTNGSPAPKGFPPVPEMMPSGVFPGFYPYPPQHSPQQQQQPPRAFTQQQPPPGWQRQ